MSARHAGGGSSLTFDLSSFPGTYILVMNLYWESVIDVGGLGELTFPKGIWLYCGSARGPGGLAARIAHHMRFSERPRWHIDYLRFAASPVQVWYVESDEIYEHDWAGILAGIEGVEEWAPGFGASDCGCRTHLFFTSEQDLFDSFCRLAGGKVKKAVAFMPGV